MILRYGGETLLLQPGATMSGFMRPSKVGPRLERFVYRRSCVSTEPTLMVFLAVVKTEPLWMDIAKAFAS